MINPLSEMPDTVNTIVELRDRPFILAENRPSVFSWSAPNDPDTWTARKTFREELQQEVDEWLNNINV